jgi:hypothetical protein
MSSPTVLAPIESIDRRASIETIEARRSAIFQLMKKVMKKGIDYGIVPGTDKPSLFKAGAEKLCALFQLAPRIHVNDLSTPDTIRYQVKVELYTQSGIFVAEGIGAASSAESKYQWRAAVCREEFDITPEDRRRTVFKRKSDGGHYTILQVRTSPEDADNTVIKMTKKRALIDAVLTATAASDIFTQDIEIEDQDDDDEGEGDESNVPPAQKPGQQPQQQPAHGYPSEPQAKRFYAKALREGHYNDAQIKRFLFDHYGVQNARDLKTKEDYEAACKWAEGGNAPPMPAQQPTQQTAAQSAQQPTRQREPGEEEPLEPDQASFNERF